MIHHTHHSDKLSKTGVNIEICLGNNLDNFQLHRLTKKENIAKSFRGLLFDSHCTCHVPYFYIYNVSQKKTSPTFLAVTRESIVGFS